MRYLFAILLSMGIGALLAEPTKAIVGGRSISTSTETTEPLPYDAEVEWLKSDTRSYIDTKYSMTSNVGGIDAVYDSIYLSQDRATWGAQTSSDKNWCMNQYADKWWIGNTGNLFSNAQTVGIKNVSWRWDNGDITGTINGIEYSASYAGTVVSGANVFLFATSQGNVAIRNGYSAIYHFAIFDNGRLVRDFIPVRFTNEQGVSEGAMYDRISRQLFRNQGTGSFIIGPDKQ